MTRNVGLVDQYARFIIGLAVIAYPVKDGSLGAEVQLSLEIW
ncbi:hypothetical protein [Bradyrhizobium acaciae]|nr:hypothetical protein [Bradyrhizobium acaciae]